MITPLSKQQAALRKRFQRKPTDVRVSQAATRRATPDPSAPQFQDFGSPQPGTYGADSTLTSMDEGVQHKPYRPAGPGIKGVFTNGATGTATDSTGAPITGVNQYGVPTTTTQGDNSTPVRSDADRAKSYLDQQSAATADTANELNLGGPEGDTPYYTSFQQETLDQIQAQKDQAAQQMNSYNYQENLNGQQTSDTRNRLESSTQAELGQLSAGGRNGPSSLSNVDLGSKIQEFNQRKIDQAMASQDDANAQIEQAKANLDLATKQNNTQLIQQYQSELDNAQLAVEQADTDYYNSLTSAQTAQTDAQKSQVASLQAFQGMVDNGQELSPDTIMSLSDQLGIPMDTLYGYYQGVSNIRADKSLDEQTKGVALEQAQQNLMDQVTGMNTQAAQAVKGLTTLRQSGASEDVIAAYKNAAGITDYNDPLTQAKLSLDQANAKIAYNEANGILTNPTDLIDLAQKTYDYYQSMGYQAGAVPTGGSYGASTYTTEDGLPGVQIAVQEGQSLDNPDTTRDEAQCGAFVNDVFGAQLMGDTIQQKESVMDKSIKVPEPGMAFVMDLNDTYGHTGIVEAVHPAQGTMDIVEDNWKKDPATGKGIVTRRTVPISSAVGFVKNPNSSSVGQGSALASVDKDLRTSVMQTVNRFDGHPAVENFQTVQEGKNFVDSLDVNTKNPADDQALIYAFAKVMDPNSVVREGEYATVQKYAQSWADSYGFDIARIFSNTQFLTPEARQNMKDTVGTRYSSSKQSYDQVRNATISTIDSIAGKKVGGLILQDYVTPGTTQNDDPLGIGATSTGYDPLGLLD